MPASFRVGIHPGSLTLGPFNGALDIEVELRWQWAWHLVSGCLARRVADGWKVWRRCPYSLSAQKSKPSRNNCLKEQ